MFAEVLDRLKLAPGRLVVAYSGGLDSHALLHYLVSNLPQSIEALHVNHGISPDSGDWQQHCETVCDDLKVPLTCFSVSVSREGSLETNARSARYQVFETFLEPGDCLLLAHHRDDQVETLMMNLFSGRAPRGMLGMPDSRALGVGEIYRPLLNTSRADLRRYAENQGLAWIEDPSNDDKSHTRNWLRHEILPQLELRWPDLRDRLQASWRVVSDQMTQENVQAVNDLETVKLGPGMLDLPKFKELSPPRREACLVTALAKSGYRKHPGQVLLAEMLKVLLPGKDETEPVGFDLSSHYLQRYRQRLYVHGVLPEPLQGGSLDKTADISNDIVKGRGVNLPAQALELRFRAGGETLFLNGHHHKLKNLLQEQGVPPQVRKLLPLIWLDGVCIGFCDIPAWGIWGVISDNYRVQPDEFGTEFGWWPPGSRNIAWSGAETEIQIEPGSDEW